MNRLLNCKVEAYKVVGFIIRCVIDVGIKSSKAAIGPAAVVLCPPPAAAARRRRLQRAGHTINLFCYSIPNLKKLSTRSLT